MESGDSKVPLGITPPHIAWACFEIKYPNVPGVRASVVYKGVTHSSSLYFHPQPGSRSWPIKFSCLTPWKFRRDPWLFSINHAHRTPREALTVSKLSTSPASKFCLDHSTLLWPQSQMGVQLSMQVGVRSPVRRQLWPRSRVGVQSLCMRLYSHPCPGSKWAQTVKAEVWCWSNSQADSQG